MKHHVSGTESVPGFRFV